MSQMGDKFIDTALRTSNVAILTVLVAKIRECQGISGKANTIQFCHNATAAFL